MFKKNAIIIAAINLFQSNAQSSVPTWKEYLKLKDKVESLERSEIERAAQFKAVSASADTKRLSIVPIVSRIYTANLEQKAKWIEKEVIEKVESLHKGRWIGAKKGQSCNDACKVCWKCAKDQDWPKITIKIIEDVATEMGPWIKMPNGKYEKEDRKCNYNELHRYPDASPMFKVIPEHNNGIVNPDPNAGKMFCYEYWNPTDPGPNHGRCGLKPNDPLGQRLCWCLQDVNNPKCPQ